MDNEKKCLLKLTRDALIVANTGQPFSRLGAISICASHRGTKRKVEPIDLFTKHMDTASKAMQYQGFLRHFTKFIATPTIRRNYYEWTIELV
ncbi:hypothetical protein [Desulfobacula sp.]